MVGNRNVRLFLRWRIAIDNRDIEVAVIIFGARKHFETQITRFIEIDKHHLYLQGKLWIDGECWIDYLREFSEHAQHQRNGNQPLLSIHKFKCWCRTVFRYI